MQPQKKPDFSIENNYKNQLIAGIDEAGRGPVAGPVVAGCVILNYDDFPGGIHDSKKLTKLKRKEIFFELQKKAKFGVGVVDEKIIDEINILQASKLAMHRALLDLQKK
jgi:ribonuclease HII